MVSAAESSPRPGSATMSVDSAALPRHLLDVIDAAETLVELDLRRLEEQESKRSEIESKLEVARETAENGPGPEVSPNNLPAAREANAADVVRLEFALRTAREEEAEIHERLRSVEAAAADLRGGPRETRAVLYLLGGVVEELEALGDGLDDEEDSDATSAFDDARSAAVRSAAAILADAERHDGRPPPTSSRVDALAKAAISVAETLLSRAQATLEEEASRRGLLERAFEARRVNEDPLKAAPAPPPRPPRSPRSVTGEDADGKPAWGAGSPRGGQDAGERARARFKTLKDARAASRVRKNLDFHIAKLSKEVSRLSEEADALESHLEKIEATQEEATGELDLLGWLLLGAEETRRLAAEREAAREKQRENRFAPSGMSVKKPEPVAASKPNAEKTGASKVSIAARRKKRPTGALANGAKATAPRPSESAPAGIPAPSPPVNRVLELDGEAKEETTDSRPKRKLVRGGAAARDRAKSDDEPAPTPEPVEPAPDSIRKPKAEPPSPSKTVPAPKPAPASKSPSKEKTASEREAKALSETVPGIKTEAGASFAAEPAPPPSPPQVAEGVRTEEVKLRVGEAGEKNAGASARGVQSPQAQAAPASAPHSLRPQSPAEPSIMDRLGPGGLDPVTVFLMLPAPLREALDRDDAEAVLAHLRTLSRTEAQSYLRRMEGSGLFTTEEFWGVGAATQTDDESASLDRLMTITRSPTFSDPNTLGPGGLDPEAVYDTLPRELKDALEMEDAVDAVLAALRKLPSGEARAHARRLEDSGLFSTEEFWGFGETQKPAPVCGCFPSSGARAPKDADAPAMQTNNMFETPRATLAEAPLAMPAEQPTVTYAEQPEAAPAEQPEAAPAEQPTVAPVEQPKPQPKPPVVRRVANSRSTPGDEPEKVQSPQAQAAPASAPHSLRPQSPAEPSIMDRLGPGGLDPVTVFLMLPAPLREALDRDDAEAVLAHLRTLSRTEAQSYLRRMEGSGLFTTEEFWGVGAATQTDDESASLDRLMTITRSPTFSDPNTLGPGGLDPEAVYDTLPRELKDALEMEDAVDAVLAALRKLPSGEARAHARRLEDSGLFSTEEFWGFGETQKPAPVCGCVVS